MRLVSLQQWVESRQRWTLEDEMDYAENAVPRVGRDWFEVAIDVSLWVVFALVLVIAIKA